MTKRLPLTQWKLVSHACSCETCQNMCQVPCWGSPAEIQKLLDLGYGDKMMLAERDHPKQKGRCIAVISPAKGGREGKDNIATETACVFQSNEGLCGLHNICKPIEGRLAICNNTAKSRQPVDLRDRVAEMWDTPEAQALVRDWVFTYGRRDYTWTFSPDGSIFCYHEDEEDEI